MLVNEPAEYPEPDKDKASNQALLHQPEGTQSALPHSPPPSQWAILFCSLPGHICHLKWWLRKFFVDYMNIFYMYAELGNDEHAEMLLKLHDLPNPSVFETTSKLGGTGLILTVPTHAEITQKLCVLNDQSQTFPQVVSVGHNRVPHAWLLNTGPTGYDNKESDRCQLSGVAHIRVMNGLMN
jgi:hypothetical protein